MNQDIRPPEPKTSTPAEHADVPSPEAAKPAKPPRGKRLSKKWLIVIAVVVVLALVGGVAAQKMGKSDGDKNNQTGNGGSNETSQTLVGGNKADANGLVDAMSLECVPRGHDNYRTNSTLAVDPTDANVAYVGVEYKGIYKTTDGGTTWKPSDTGVRGYPREGDATKKCIQELGRTVIDPKDNKHILMSRVESPGTLNILFSENAGVWETNDAGATWHQLVKDKMNASGSRAIAFDPTDSKVMYYGVNNMLPSFGGTNNTYTEYFNKTGILYKTTDAGKTWAELPTGAEHGFRAMTTFVDAKNPKTLWLFPFTVGEKGGDFDESKQTGPMKSVDGGQTWTKMASLFPTDYKVLVGGEVNPVDATNAFVPTQNTKSIQKSFVTTDGGTTWKVSNIYQYIVAYDPTDTTGKRLLGYNPYESGGGIYESLDKGVTWAKYASVPPEVNNSDQLGVRIEGFAFSKSAKGTIYMSGSNALVWKSTDNGKTWKNVLNITSAGGKNKNKDGSEKSREQDPSAR